MILINRQVNNHYSMGGTHFLQTGYLLLNRNAPLLYFYRYTELPDGQFGCFSADDKVGRNSFKDGRAKFAYIGNEELEETA